MSGNLFAQIFSSWRSILSVILAYAIMVALFFWKPDLLNQMFDFATTSQLKLRNAVSHQGELGSQASFLFGAMIAPPSIFVTLMILFVRVVVVSVVLWFAALVVNGLTGKRARSH